MGAERRHEVDVEGGPAAALLGLGRWESDLVARFEERLSDRQATGGRSTSLQRSLEQLATAQSPGTQQEPPRVEPVLALGDVTEDGCRRRRSNTPSAPSSAFRSTTATC